MAVIEALDERDKRPIVNGSIDEWGTLLNSLYGLTEDKINEVIENLNTLLSISSVFQIKAYPTKADFPTTGLVNIIYYAIDIEVRYMWDGMYISLSTGDSSVSSVNGEVGEVVLDKSDIGLNNADNTSDITKATTVNYGGLNTSDKTIVGAINEIDGEANIHYTDYSNPHSVTKTQVGLGNVDDTSDITKLTISEFNTLTTTDKKIVGSINELDLETSTHYSDYTNPHKVTKTQVGLSNVDNTSDLNKPISTTTQTALNSKADKSSPTFTGTITTPNINVTDTIAVTNAIVSTSTSFDILSGVDNINIGDSTSNVNVKGNLIVEGITTTINSTITTIKDPILTLGEGTTIDDNKDRGIEFKWNNGVDNKIGFFGFDDSTGKFTFIPDATNTSEVFTGSAGIIVASLEGNSSTASKLETARDISLSGDVSGSISFDGSGNVDIVSTVADNSHNHTSANISDATDLNTADMIVKRDSNGDFSANEIMADLIGNSDTTTKLASSITIGTLIGDVTSTGSSFDGSANNTNSTTISSNVVDNSKLAQMGAYTIKANNTNATANSQDVSVEDIQTMLDIKNISIKYALVMG